MNYIFKISNLLILKIITKNKERIKDRNRFYTFDIDKINIKQNKYSRRVSGVKNQTDREYNLNINNESGFVNLIVTDTDMETIETYI